MPPLTRDLHKNARITQATTTVVKTGAGALYRLIFGGTLGAITVYDNTEASGTVLMTCTPPAHGVWDIGLKFNTGLTIVTGAATTVTVIYE